MTILRDSVTQPKANIGKALSDTACNSRGAPWTRVNQLLHSNPNLWRGCDMAGQGFHGIGTGYHELDDILPGRGWPSSGLVEVIARHSGMGELQLLIPLMQSVIKQGKWILCVAPPYLLNAPALTQAGIDIGQILIVKQDTPCKDALWSMEKAMQTETCGLVLAWQNWLPGKVLRRLQLAAEVGDTLAVLFKHNDSKYSPSSLRLQIKGSVTDNRDFSRAEVTVIKARGNFRPLSAQFSLYPKTLSV
ncbi:MAG: translesion DNA synthesis-associated protein ImuA [Pseudomonadota bacterium]|nr:translesion DNA synthesis-associated protein ImuA [Pseudomonadota bacterium]MEC7126306.1 translesion DNA synthesis-associated protein ImuA [Pseudomonadota bacterium]MEC7460405.1 translesion DNA synthesis-associated protein ImuA [Pseudomonadota bacterium]MEC7581967.1 translesion DNA synthesis-associated protein ImuA [Pseudomonadota bacterium]MEC7997435.1 translesion DNA synthesis-associated protein ImuA [Pseudomonadota bacterium]